MTPSRGRSGEHALRSRVQRRRDLPLRGGYRPGDGGVHAGQKLPPRPAVPEPVLDHLAGHPAGQNLSARHDAMLRSL
jgi:hypothetical protein